MVKKQSALIYVLKAFIPYSKESVTLGFKPNKFFNELERSSSYKRKTLQTAYYRARDRGLLDKDNYLTNYGWDKVQPYVAKTLQKDVVLMIIFDIPEEMSYKRRELRTLLKKLNFKLEQHSVWISHYDHTEYLKKYTTEQSLTRFVKIYEAAIV